MGIDEDRQLGHVFRRLRSAHGVDFTHYKRTTIQRRLERRMTLRRIDSLDEYRALIDSDPLEMEALYQDFLIRVTEFFRDPDSFAALDRCVFPAVCEGRSAKERIRIWVPGCATGEEAYSVAIALQEYLGDRPQASRIQIFGTDVSEAALQKARAGVYPASALHGVSAERLERFFVKDNGHFRIAEAVRDLCLFARHDVTCDPPFSRLDFISCRNLLIYLDDIAQRRILRTFHFALRPQGMLFLGPAESVSQSSELYEQADKHFRVFRRLPNTVGGAIAERPPVLGSQTLDLEENGRSVRVEGPVPANNRDDPGTEGPVGAPPPLVRKRTRRVLIVDDHEEIRESVARLVRTWGHEVATVGDGPSALSLAERFQPECAIVDLSLSGMNGIELARRLRQVFPPERLYMIALTGHTGADISEACLAAGFDVHLVKPGGIKLLEQQLGDERPDSETTSH